MLADTVLTIKLWARRGRCWIDLHWARANLLTGRFGVSVGESEGQEIGKEKTWGRRVLVLKWKHGMDLTCLEIISHCLETCWPPLAVSGTWGRNWKRRNLTLFDVSQVPIRNKWHIFWMHLENPKKKLKYNLNALFQKTSKRFFTLKSFLLEFHLHILYKWINFPLKNWHLGWNAMFCFAQELKSFISHQPYTISIWILWSTDKQNKALFLSCDLHMQ